MIEAECAMFIDIKTSSYLYSESECMMICLVFSCNK